jgi:hypothetical protein
MASVSLYCGTEAGRGDPGPMRWGSVEIEFSTTFCAGAQHLFGSIMSVLEPGDEPTDKDLQRMDLIHKELDAFIKDFSLRHTPTKGTA